ncbi:MULTISPECIES: SusC/RagA family TonB-linked outer membrane protein [Butyricimonas]|uniref:SusC/RagA family TonB-linked outer membrane protein n=1 Tax=Butyricimonas TaxID=574697 RepID=UPI0007FB254A|nr:MULTISPECIES: SusC/RagA family TonB-linked outer membrane protein [Butyricimonas]
MKKNAKLKMFCRLSCYFRRLSFIVCVVGILSFMNTEVYGQEKTKRISLKVTDVSVLRALHEVNRLCDNLVMFRSEEVMKEKGRVTLDVKNKSVLEVVKACLKGTALGCVEKDGKIIITVEGVKTLRITGVVTDEQKRPLPGVTVLVKGLTLGTVTDAEGRYVLNLPAMEKLTLLFSFVGMETREVVYAGKDTINVVMREDVMDMDEVVVTGYQTLKKRSQVGSSNTVKSSDLVLNGTQTLEQALQGKVPGMMVMSRSGLTGTRQRVRVRGTSTLLGNAEPVWVVDGIIQEDPLPFETNELNNLNPDNMDMIRNFVGGAISWLNPNDIETVTVLKDAASTAIYGVKAANGVIVISTKKGKAGRMSVSYNGNFSVTPRLNYNRMELMNSQQRVEVSREAYETGIPLDESGNYSIGYTALANAYKRQEITLEEFSEQAQQLERNNTDYFDILFRNAFSHNHTVSVSGGSDKGTYHASMGINNTVNTAKGNEQTQYTGNLSIAQTMWERLTLNFSLGVSYAKTQAFAGEDPYTYASQTNRAIPCYNPDGSLAYNAHKSDGYLFNVVNELRQSGNQNTLTSVSASLAARWRIKEWLSYNLSLGFGTSSSIGESWFTEQSHYISGKRGYNYEEFAEGSDRYKASFLPHGGEYNHRENKNMNYTLRNQLDFTNVFNGLHSVTASVGQEIRSVKQDGMDKQEYGYLHTRGRIFVNLPKMVGNTVNPYLRSKPVNIVDSEENYVSYYGTMSYMFDNRYAFNASVRMDASNRFGQNKDTRYLPVWSLGVRWNLGYEHWMQGQDLVNDMSFRFSYGWQGNVVTTVSPDLIAEINVGDSGDYKLTIKNLPAPDLKWEKVQNLNLGVDFGLFRNKIMGSFEYYWKKTKDMVVNKDVPYANGVSSRPVNGGNMSNSGWDLGVNFVPVRTKDFVIAVGMTTGKVYNKVESTLDPTGAWSEATSGNLNKNGYPVSSFWAFRYTGLSPEHGGPLFDLTGSELEGAKSDATLYMDYAGKMEPDFTAGLNLSINYKTLILTTSFYLSTGNQQFLAPLTTSYSSIPSEYENMSTEWLKRWRKPGDEKYTKVPSLPNRITSAKPLEFLDYTNGISPYELYAYSTARVVDAWYLKCGNVQLSYTLPAEKLPKIFQNLSFNCSISNPFSIVSKDFLGRDPEVALGSQPLSRTISFGINASF